MHFLTLTYNDSASYIEDLDWSYQYLLNSLEPNLLKTVLCTLCHDFAPSQQGRPLTLAIIIDEVINLSKSAITYINKSIHQYGIKTVKGENIDAVCRQF